MGQGGSCDFGGALDEVGKTVDQFQKQGLAATIHENFLLDNPIEAKLIKPGTPQQTNMPWRNFRDQYTDGVMSKGLRQSHVGRIVFASETIGMNEDDASLLEDRFELDEDIDIHCRAYW